MMSPYEVKDYMEPGYSTRELIAWQRRMFGERGDAIRLLRLAKNHLDAARQRWQEKIFQL